MLIKLNSKKLKKIVKAKYKSMLKLLIIVMETKIKKIKKINNFKNKNKHLIDKYKVKLKL